MIPYFSSSTFSIYSPNISSLRYSPTSSQSPASSTSPPRTYDDDLNDSGDFMD